jgi:predicted esterase
MQISEKQFLSRMGNMSFLERKWTKFNSEKRNACVLYLPGRAFHAGYMCSNYYQLGINAFILGITPIRREWYPMPNGVDDQENAVAGLFPAVNVIEDVVGVIETKYEIPRSKIILAGYSAGAVMAVTTAVMSHTPFAGVVAHSGAVLDTTMIPRCTDENNSPILFTHSADDLIFEWEERFLPTYDTLERLGYKLYDHITMRGSHQIQRSHLRTAGKFIEAIIDRL